MNVHWDLQQGIQEFLLVGSSAHKVRLPRSLAEEVAHLAGIWIPHVRQTLQQIPAQSTIGGILAGPVNPRTGALE
jgi:hypothetical protein